MNGMSEMSENERCKWCLQIMKLIFSNQAYVYRLGRENKTQKWLSWRVMADETYPIIHYTSFPSYCFVILLWSCWLKYLK